LISQCRTRILAAGALLEAVPREDYLPTLWPNPSRLTPSFSFVS
jgi:hypothetical protein